MQTNEQAQTEETQPETPETPEQPVEETPPEEVEAKDAGAEEGEETEEGEEVAPDDKEGEEQPEAGKPKHKRTGGWQRKMDRQSRDIERLERELAAVRSGQQQPPAQPAKDKTPDEKAAEYIDSLVEKRLAARDAQRQQETVNNDFQRRAAEVRAANPDFDDVVMSVNAPVSQALQEALLTSEQGPAIMYQLAKNPAELARLSALRPLDAAREIGRLEAKASFTASPKTPKPANRPPAPPTNVNGSGSSTRSLDDLPIAEYKRAFRSKRR